MSPPTPGAPLLVCCSVLRAELESLLRAEWPGVEAVFEDSMLHMHPARLGRRLGEELASLAACGRRPVVVFGDCCPDMRRLCAAPGAARVDALNCVQLLLGREPWRRLSREGAFFLLPEWARRWPEVFQAELGMDAETARGLMTELHTRLVYLDTGVVPVPWPALRACASFAGLPVEVLPISLDPLREAVAAALARVGNAP